MFLGNLSFSFLKMVSRLNKIGFIREMMMVCLVKWVN